MTSRGPDLLQPHLDPGRRLQFWSEECTEIVDADWHSEYLDSRGRRENAMETTFAIPRQTRWMTVRTNDNLKVE